MKLTVDSMTVINGLHRYLGKHRIAKLNLSTATAPSLPGVRAGDCLACAFDSCGVLRDQSGFLGRPQVELLEKPTRPAALLFDDNDLQALPDWEGDSPLDGQRAVGDDQLALVAPEDHAPFGVDVDVVKPVDPWHRNRELEVAGGAKAQHLATGGVMASVRGS
jgi:hypothetical protein